MSIDSCHDPVKDPPLLTMGRPGEREDAIQEEAREDVARDGPGGQGRVRTGAMIMGRDRAKELLRHYFTLACKAEGRQLDRDCYAEIDEIVDAIVDQAVAESIRRVAATVEAQGVRAG